MTRDRRLLVAVAFTIGFVGALPIPVDAHAVLVGAPASVTAGADVALTMNVPHERDDATYNVGIAIRLPEGWTGVSCQSKATWTCSIATESGFVVIHFDKDANSAVAEDETFRFAAHAGGAAGSVSLPTLQTYSTGESVAWIGPAGSAEPAPTLQVTGAPPTTTEATVTPTNAPTAIPTTAAPVAVVATTTSTTAAAPPATLATTTTTTLVHPTTSTTEASAVTVTSTTSTTSTNPELALAPSTTALAPASADDGTPVAAIVAIVLALLAAGAGAFVYVRRRSRSRSA